MDAAGQTSQPATTPNVLLPSRTYQPVQSETRANQSSVAVHWNNYGNPNASTTPIQQQPQLAPPARAGGYSQPNYEPARNQQYTPPVAPAVTYSRPNYTPPPAYSAPQPRYTEPAPVQTYHSAPAYSPPPSYNSSGGSGGSHAGYSAPASSSSSSPSRGR